ncbi:Uu.00g124470.m01.CDS01 [Anthostomella pinea]|uniref:Uu.00g124470.m01.CDS01 n=1 Tax=Anthostomella pinea TaxID=933095 RepID=A0AAI8YF69_9PEZI|nr:Uu.00g124470.m01.CDS01 [Anthostomella pinea]
MADASFPFNAYLTNVVQLLDAIQHKDTSYTHAERAHRLRHAYSAGAQHFAQSRVQAALATSSTTSPQRLEAALRTTARMVVCAWVDINPDLQAVLTIFWTYQTVLDDATAADPRSVMGTFVQDLVSGTEQKSPWWRLVNAYMPVLLEHYGPFCSLNIYRGVVDYFQGCWIEQHNIQGYPGSSEFPDFQRRLSGLGPSVSGTLFPKASFDEQRLMAEIAVATSTIDVYLAQVNDLFSFYKEFDIAHDQTGLVNNYCHVDGLGREAALGRLTRNVVRVARQMLAVFGTLTGFMHGYVTWYFLDERYRMSEVYQRAGNDDDDAVGLAFRRYYEAAWEDAHVYLAEWAEPSLTSLLMGPDSAGYT